jgi:DNA-binding Lrp family transcriptional regulator
MNNITEKIIKELQADLPLTENPYQTIAKKLGITEKELVKRLKQLKANGQLKRIGVILKHQKSGYNANSMAVFTVEENHMKQVGRKLAESPKVSHCYERAAQPQWPYNLYAMVHGKNEDEVKNFILDFAKTNKIAEYNILVSEEELKKTSMRYVK